MLLVSMLIATLSACENPTASHQLTPDQLRRSQARREPHAIRSSMEPSPFLCTTSVSTPNGPHQYRYGRFYLHFPAGMVKGGTRQFRYVLPNSDGITVGAASCVIPASRVAISLTVRFFRLTPRQLRAQEGHAGDIAILCGGADDECPLEPIKAVAPRLKDDDSCDPAIHYGCDEEGGGGDPDDPGNPWGDGWGGGDDPNPPDPPEPCDTQDLAIDDDQVQWGFQGLWLASNADDALENRLEQGGWIVETSDGEFRVHDWGIDANFCGGDFYVNWPPEGQDAIVGFVHTHPYEIDEAIKDCTGNPVPYTGGPSGPDRNTSVALGQTLGRSGPLPGYVIDEDQISRYDGWNVPQDARYGRCGY